MSLTFIIGAILLCVVVLQLIALISLASQISDQLGGIAQQIRWSDLEHKLENIDSNINKIALSLSLIEATLDREGITKPRA
jgi:hypothetical protein